MTDVITAECAACGEPQRVNLTDDEHYCYECGAPFDLADMNENLYLDD